jgi:hypothetical protein
LQRTGCAFPGAASDCDHGQDCQEQHCDAHFHEDVQVHLNRLLHLYEALEARVRRLEHIESVPLSAGPLSPTMGLPTVASGHSLPSVPAGTNSPQGMLSPYSVCPRNIYHHTVEEVAV